MTASNGLTGLTWPAGDGTGGVGRHLTINGSEINAFSVDYDVVFGVKPSNQVMTAAGLAANFGTGPDGVAFAAFLDPQAFFMDIEENEFSITATGETSIQISLRGISVTVPALDGTKWNTPKTLRLMETAAMCTEIIMLNPEFTN